MNITDATTGNLITVEPKTGASASNGSISQTSNLGIDGKNYTDEQINAEDSNAPVIVERGLTYIDNIDYEGTINIEISQKEHQKDMFMVHNIQMEIFKYQQNMYHN